VVAVAAAAAATAQPAVVAGAIHLPHAVLQVQEVGWCALRGCCYGLRGPKLLQIKQSLCQVLACAEAQTDARVPVGIG
jgi:hypothetical protein